MTEQEWLNNDELALSIYNNKYRYKGESFDNFIKRISGNDEILANLIINKKFIFGGRILASRGVTDRKVTYSNCYVIKAPEDNLGSIFECAKKLAQTFSYGGGCGIDLSLLRPNGAEVHNASKTSSGPVSFMDMFSQVTQTISQNGRRGALMISLDVNHPDIEEFINCKTDLNRVKYANISVRINDKFMEAVRDDRDYLLRWPCDFGVVENQDYSTIPYNSLINKQYGNITVYFKRVKARELFMKLAENNHEYAEPGILYWDEITHSNLLDKDSHFHYAGVNPCAEEPLPAGGSCLLGSINLSEYVLNPFLGGSSVIDFKNLEKDITVYVKALNNVLDEGINLHPLQEQRDTVKELRQIGLGTMGLADMLIKLGMTYGSSEALGTVDHLFMFIAESAIKASIELAKKTKVKCNIKPEVLLNSTFLKDKIHLDENVVKDLKKYGIANSQLLTCAPTGSIGTMFNVSTGVEPLFALSYSRKTISLNKKETTYEVNVPIVDEYKKVFPKSTELPKYFITSCEIKPIDRILMQSVMQKSIDASISSTINLPKEATIQDVSQIYMDAWGNRLKGVTVYRSGCKREGILTTSNTKLSINRTAPKRPQELQANFHTVKVKGEQFIVLVGILENKPYEIFAFKPNIVMNIQPHVGIITKKSKMHYSFKSDFLEIKELELMNNDVEERAATLYASMLLRHGVAIKYIIKTAKKVNDNITSFSSAMCRVLSSYIGTEVDSSKCPKCGGKVINEGGCSHCTECGWSKCD